MVNRDKDGIPEEKQETDVTYHAGFPNAAEDKSGFGLSLDQLVVRHRESTYFWHLAQDMTSDPGWKAGDIVVVDRALAPTPGDWVVVVIENEFILCRYRSKTQLLRADGEKVEEGSIWGAVTYVVQRAKQR
jgi:DNA polymerase V